MKTKIKKILAAAAFIFSIQTFNAQVLSGGIVGGISTGAVKIEDIGNRFTDVISGNNIVGYEVGAFAKLHIMPFYIKAMPLYSFNTGSVSYQTENNGTNINNTNNFSFQKFEIPVLLGLRIIGPLNIEAGPVYNYILQSQDNFGTNSVSLQRNGIGYRAGVVLELWQLLLHVSYEGAVYNSSNIDKATFKEPYKLVFGVGIKIGGRTEKESK
ncbi:MAG TPA: outer membrane beta-barrel protein [Bacteroidia bacterium]|nr:outer membrane beta-barrel protein [Bacteroidia bacterium]